MTLPVTIPVSMKFMVVVRVIKFMIISKSQHGILKSGIHDSAIIAASVYSFFLSFEDRRLFNPSHHMEQRVLQVLLLHKGRALSRT